MTHVTHVRHALSVLDDGRIRQRLVYDNSRLTGTRIHVVWLSPNDWTGAGGSRYGSVEFGFEWRALIAGKRAFWVGAANYAPRACRILLSTIDYTPQGYLPYDPTSGDGPWWHEMPADKHWWNGTFCLEIMVESDVFLRDADRMTFTKHHAERCNTDPGGGCRDAAREWYEASADLVCAWASGIYAARTFPATCRSGITERAWNNLVVPLGRVEQWGTVDADDELAPMLGRALLSAGARRDDDQRAAIARQFRSRAAAVRRTLARIITASFGVDENQLHVPDEDAEVTAIPPAAVENGE